MGGHPVQRMRVAQGKRVHPELVGKSALDTRKLVQDPLAMKILDGAVLHGDHVIVDADKKAGKMTFKVSERVGEPAAAKK